MMGKPPLDSTRATVRTHHGPTYIEYGAFLALAIHQVAKRVENMDYCAHVRSDRE